MHSKIIGVLVGTLCTAAVWADEPEPVGKPLWEVGMVAGAVTTPAYPASVDRAGRGLVLPYVIYRGEVLRAERGGIGARVARSDDYELDVGLAASLPASSGSVTVRRGMPDIGTLLELGPRWRQTLARPGTDSRVRLELPLRAVLEVEGGVRDRGTAFEPALVYDKRNAWNGWGLGVSVGLMVGDQRLNHYFYGVDTAYVTAERPRYEAQAGLIATRVGLRFGKDITPDVRVAGFMRYESYANSANRDSPLYTASSGTSVGIAVSWSFAHSKRRAAY